MIVKTNVQETFLVRAVGRRGGRHSGLLLQDHLSLHTREGNDRLCMLLLILIRFLILEIRDCCYLHLYHVRAKVAKKRELHLVLLELVVWIRIRPLRKTDMSF